MKIFSSRNYISLFTLILLISCSSNKDTLEDEYVELDFKEQNEKEIISYISNNDLNATKSDSGLYYVINELGTGNYPIETDNITVNLKGHLTNDYVFNEYEELTFDIQQLILGWVEGIQYFKEGGSGILIIPSHLGYGSNPYFDIPAGAVLVFEIKLISIN